MLFQLSIGEALSRRLSTVFGIDLSIQPTRNQALARMGSRSGAFATIDLKSASDSISLKLLKIVLPADMLAFLSKFKCDETRIPGIGYRRLPIISTMGNGFNFPLMTLIFASIVQAVYRLYDIPLIIGENANFGVFGDDIIVETRAVFGLYKALSMFGFIINKDKSFFEGSFRESCGADYYQGLNVRAFYLKRLDTMQDYYVAINGLNDWSARTGVWLPRTVRWLLARCKWLPVPLWESEDAGIKIPYSLVERRLSKDKFTQSPLYKYFAVKPKAIAAEGIVENPDGAMVAFLSGNIRNGMILRRTIRRMYQLRWNCAPSWDTCAPPWDRSLPCDGSDDPVSIALTGFLGQRWNTAVVFNLYG